MKTIGLIGGLTWVSSADYYRLLNELTNERLGDANAAKIILYSVNFEEIKRLTFVNDWQGISTMMCAIAQKLERAGADCLLLGANTMHKIAPDIQAAVSIPLLHVADVTGKAIQQQALGTIALLGTKYTMELGFYQERLEKYGIATLVPNEEDRQYINNAVYNEMGKNIFLSSTKERFLSIIDTLVQQGAEGVILGCTEIPILIKQKDCQVPVFDTTFLHAQAAVAFALETVSTLPA